MCLPPGADPNLIYVGEAIRARDSQPFVRAVWFTPAMADELAGRPRGSHETTTRSLWETMGADTVTSAGGSGTQSAGGAYSEMGIGVLPGPGREYVTFADGTRSVLPFPRRPELSRRTEPALTDFMSSVSVVLHEVLPERATRSHKPPQGCPSKAVAMYQYPHLREGTPHLASHQVVVRGPRACGAAMDSRERDRQAVLSMSDLHLDPFDGGGELGSVTVHTCRRLERLDSDARNQREREREADLLAHRGIAVFAESWGGKGVHIHSMVPGWHCALVFRTADQLHGSVFLEQDDTSGFGLEGLEMARVVTYPLKRVDTLLQRLAREPSRYQDVAERSHEWLRNRASQS